MRGQANAGPRINVKDWHFVPSNRSDSNTGHPGANQNSQPNGGAATPGAAGNGSYQCREIPMAATRIRQCLAAIHSREWLLLTVPTRLLQMADSIRLRQTEPVSHRAATRRRAVIPECQITEVCRAVSQLTAFKMCRNRWHPSCPINSQRNPMLRNCIYHLCDDAVPLFMSGSGDFPSSFRACLRIMNQKGISS